MRYVNMLFIILMMSFKLSAQTVVNAEKLEGYIRDGYYAGGEADIGIERGNSDVTEFEAMTITGYKSQKHWIKFLSGFKFLSEEKTSLIRRYFGQLRYNFILSDAYRTFVFYQLQHNRSLLLKNRQLIGVGFRGSFAISDLTQFDLGTGLMVERESLDSEKITPDDDPISKDFRLANLFLLRHTFNQLFSIMNVAYFQPRVTDFKDFRLFDELSLIINIRTNFKLDVSLVWLYDSRPPMTVKRYDFSMKNGVIFHF